MVFLLWLIFLIFLFYFFKWLTDESGYEVDPKSLERKKKISRNEVAPRSLERKRKISTVREVKNPISKKFALWWLISPINQRTGEMSKEEREIRERLLSIGFLLFPAAFISSFAIALLGITGSAEYLITWFFFTWLLDFLNEIYKER